MSIYTGKIESITINGHTFKPMVDADRVRDLAPGRASVPVTFYPRGRRQLLTGRPRPPRAETKELNRQRRMLRKLFVNEAGRAGDAPYWAFHDFTDAGLLSMANGRRVSVPRSLRASLGRYVGGGR